MFNIFKEEIEKNLLANNVDIHYKYYKYTEDYKRNFPVAVTLIVIGITLTCCTPLQVKTMEVKG